MDAKNRLIKTDTLVLGGLMAASPACAQSVSSEIVRQMSRQGFGNVIVEKTWLGRTRITGTRAGGSRKIIVNPKTGEILRDLWLNAQGQVRAADIDPEEVDEDSAKSGIETSSDTRDDGKDARDSR